MRRMLELLRQAPEAGGPAAGTDGAAADAVSNDALGVAQPTGEADGAKTTAADTPTGGDPAKADDKEGDKKEADKAAAPIDIKALRIPEGLKVEETTLTALATVLSDEKLSPQERAQQLLDQHTQALRAVAEAPFQEWKTTQEGWVKEIAANKDYGSGNPKTPLKPEVARQVSQLIDQFGGDTVRDGLIKTGANNNPAIVDFVVKIASKMTEAGDHLSGKPAAAPKTAAQAIYPDLPSSERSV